MFIAICPSPMSHELDHLSHKTSRVLMRVYQLWTSYCNSFDSVSIFTCRAHLCCWTWLLLILSTCDCPSCEDRAVHIPAPIWSESSMNMYNTFPFWSISAENRSFNQLSVPLSWLPGTLSCNDGTAMQNIYQCTNFSSWKNQLMWALTFCSVSIFTFICCLHGVLQR